MFYKAKINLAQYFKSTVLAIYMRATEVSFFFLNLFKKKNQTIKLKKGIPNRYQ